ncbi:MAG: hypothetical protein U0271_42580 [Polyangiaceae bacterium]
MRMRWLTGIAVLMLATEARAEDKAKAEEPPESFEVGGFVFRPIVEVRVRGEYRRNPLSDGLYVDSPILSKTMPVGTSDLPYEDEFYVWERARLGLEVEYGPVTARVTMQDVRGWGTRTYTAFATASGSTGSGFGGSGAGSLGAVHRRANGDLPVTEPFEAYLDVHTNDRNVFFRVGRQEVEIGDGRLIGASDDRPQGRSLDAVRLFGKVGDFDLQALMALLVMPGEPTFTEPDQDPNEPRALAPGAQLYVLDGVYHGAPYLSAELTGIARIVRQPLVTSLTPSDTFVGAARLFGDYRGVRYSVVGAIEGGRVAYAGQTDLGTLFAGAVAGRVDWETSLPWHITFGAQGAYATGTPVDGDLVASVGTFDPILPDTTKHFGQGGFYAWSNLIEGGADIAVRPVDEFRALAGYRFVGLADPKGPWRSASLVPVGQSSTNESNILGHVVVVDLEAQPWKPLRIAAHYGLMILDDAAKQIFVDARPGLDASRAPDFAEYLAADLRLDLP